ncbi:orotate phosphoribosyltransferase [Vulcanisaeta thermophila]|uniref:orotate phosphoribosyltransferase n=1 Tax=Vulcanisaeta thermophila TaxID=867917 RepID=UPI000852F560|nr:orotate phosphoribosyltransferase [Vulcanisaeta thermophila]
MDALFRRLFEVGAVRFGRFKLTSGLESPFYIDMRVTISYPDIYREVVSRFVDLLRGLDFDKVAGIETAGIPWASMIAYAMGKGLVYVRKSQKGHGASRLVEGDLRVGDRVVVVDDVVTTGSSIANAINVLRGQGANVVLALAFIDREQGGAKAIEKLGVRFRAVFRVTELFNSLLELGLISRDTYEEVMRYISGGVNEST